MKKLIALICLFPFFLPAQSSRSSRVLDDGSNAGAWTAFNSAGVEVTHGSDKGAVRFTVGFLKGSGYGGIVRNFHEPFPENYEISFMMKSTVPVNNFEIKVSDDSAGSNIWWVNNKGYTYPSEWKRIVVKKRHLSFAWGPSPAPLPKKLSRIEIVVTAGTGGQGSVWIDDLTLTELPVLPAVTPKPEVTASSVGTRSEKPLNILSAIKGWWASKTSKNEWIEFDLKYEKEFGAVKLTWDPKLKDVTYDIQASFDGRTYETIRSLVKGKAGTVFHFLPESEARFIRLVLKQNGANVPFRLEEMDAIASESISTPNHYYEHVAASAPKGMYPRYFLKQQPYWTVVGVPSDRREGLFNEDAVVEVDRQHFTVEPFIVLSKGRELLHWNNAVTAQSLEENYIPIPTVIRKYSAVELKTTLLASGEPEQSALMGQYIVRNTSSLPLKGSFFLAFRPFQVNPTSQWLNFDGGFAGMPKINFEGNRVTAGDKSVVVSGQPAASGAAAVEQGDITDFIAVNSVPPGSSAENDRGMTSGAFQYHFDLKPGDSLVVVAAIPFTPAGHRWTAKLPTAEEFAKTFGEVKAYWQKRLNTVEFTVNAEAQRYVDIIRSNLAYILINKDRYGFQPGSRSYERSWIRDGSMTSDALLKLGITEEPKRYLEWYSGFQYESGAVPCVVDTRGPDPVPEHDSHGQLIFACMEYFRFTGDTAFLRARWNTIDAAVHYIQSLRAQRMTAEYRDGGDDKRAFYGLVTESISHEGYSDKPMHSYWDNFFVLKGLKDAAAAATVLGYAERSREYDSLSKAFRADLYRSIALAMKNKGINFIPGCVEKGDFDATSTSIALFPNGEMKYVPQPAYNTTFDKYYEWFVQRAKDEIPWEAYTPYEIRNVGTFVYLGQKERAHFALEYFLRDRRPEGWNHWAEVVANGERTMRFIGDMPHTWVGSDYINAIRAMFAYEIDDDHSIVLGAGLKDAWVNEGLTVNNLPTHFGTLSYTIAPQPSGNVKISISGNVDASTTPVMIPVSLLTLPLVNATVNGVAVTRKEGCISVRSLPATVELTYERSH